MAFLEENCVLNILTDGILSECHPFVCGDDDMDEFFQKDALDYTRYRMGKSYCFRMKDDTQTIVACFTVSNDSIRIYESECGSLMNQTRQDAALQLLMPRMNLTCYASMNIMVSSPFFHVR